MTEIHHFIEILISRPLKIGQFYTCSKCMTLPNKNECLQYNCQITPADEKADTICCGLWEELLFEPVHEISNNVVCATSEPLLVA